MLHSLPAFKTFLILISLVHFLHAPFPRFEKVLDPHGGAGASDELQDKRISAVTIALPSSSRIWLLRLLIRARMQTAADAC